MQEEVLKQIETLISGGRFFEATALAEKAAKESDSLRLKQLHALSVSKSGNPQAALEILLPVQASADDSETAGILGGIYKELFKKHQDSRFAILSRDTYAKNFSATRSYYTGINAATMSAIAGKSMQGREIASAVLTMMAGQPLGFWELATMGEAYLLTKNRDQCVESYIKARQLAGNDWGKVLSVHSQLWLLNHYVPVPKEVLKIFSPPEVVAFAGHMIDAPGRTAPRFPAIIEGKVKESIRSAIRTLHASIGYCSVANGGDILFAEAMAEEGGELHILIPFDKQEFIHTSLRFAGEEWVTRFENLIAKFPVSYITPDAYGGNDDLFSLLAKVIFGSAILRSQTYHQEPYLLTVLSEYDMKMKEGGTRDTIKMWPYPLRYTNINPDALYSTQDVVKSEPVMQTSEITKVFERPALYIAYIDISDIHVMEKERLEKLVSTFSVEQQVVFKIFQVVDNYMMLGLETEIALMDIIRSIWNSTAPFKPVKPLRISLHAGPVYVKNPENDNDIILLKRISEITPAGSICVSANFAAVLALHPKKFQLDNAGVITFEDSNENVVLYQVHFK